MHIFLEVGAFKTPKNNGIIIISGQLRFRSWNQKVMKPKNQKLFVIFSAVHYLNSVSKAGMVYAVNYKRFLVNIQSKKYFHN
jgi:hypothetical protein